MGDTQEELMNSSGVGLSKLDQVQILDRGFKVLERSIA